MRFLLLFFLALSAPLLALVSIAPVDIGSDPGFSGNVSGSLSAKSGNTDKKEYLLGFRVQYDQGEDYLVWGTFSYNYGKNAGVKNENKIYGHVRAIYALEEENDWCGELFVQLQQDEFKDINKRSIEGAGVRWRFLDSDECGQGYAGVGGIFERIDYSHPLINPSENNRRINSYIAYTKNFSVSSKLSYVGYYQPKFRDSADYVTSQTVELIVPIYGKLNLSLLAKYLFDNRPPVGVEKKDTAYLTNLVWEF